MKRYRARRRSGFTLIEMIVATLILAIGVVGAMGAFNMATKASTYAREIQTATMLARQHMSDLELQPTQLSGGDTEGDFGEDYPGYRYKQTIEATDYADLFKVTVTVTWGGPFSNHEKLFTTFLSNPQNVLNTTPATSSTSTNGGGTNGGGTSGP